MQRRSLRRRGVASECQRESMHGDDHVAAAVACVRCGSCSDSAGRGTWSVGGTSGTGVSGGSAYGEATVDGVVVKVPPQTDAYQLPMVVPSVSSFGFLARVSNEARRLVTLVEF